MNYVFLAVGVVFLTLFCIARDKKGSTKAICYKTVVSVAFIAAAISSLRVNYAEETLLPALLMIGGLVMGLIGDITLDFKIYLKGLSYEGSERDADNMTYLGMACFAIGHVLYIVATALRGGELQPDLLWTALISIGLVASIFFLSIKVMRMNFGKYLLFSVGYAFLLCWFVAFSIWRLAQSVSTANVLLMAGSIAFIVSDLILSMTYFSKSEDYNKSGIANPESKFMIVANHVTYYVAQFLIAFAIAYI